MKVIRPVKNVNRLKFGAQVILVTLGLDWVVIVIFKGLLNGILPILVVQVWFSRYRKHQNFDVPCISLSHFIFTFLHTNTYNHMYSNTPPRVPRTILTVHVNVSGLSQLVWLNFRFNVPKMGKFNKSDWESPGTLTCTV